MVCVEFVTASIGFLSHIKVNIVDIGEGHYAEGVWEVTLIIHIASIIGDSAFNFTGSGYKGGASKCIIILPAVGSDQTRISDQDW